MQDKTKKGRQVKGEAHPEHVLTEEIVIAIRKLYAEKHTYEELSALFGVEQSTIGRIVHYEAWKHVGGVPYQNGLTEGIRKSNHKLTEEEVLLILQLGESMSHQEIASNFGVAKSTIGNILTKKSWKHLQ